MLILFNISHFYVLTYLGICERKFQICSALISKKMMSATSSGHQTTLQLLTQFEHQYSVHTAEITFFIGQLAQTKVEELGPAAQSIRKALAEVEDLLEQMELSVREIDAARFNFLFRSRRI
jgi:hypothetical protein